jgi:hypothetical protein
MSSHVLDTSRSQEHLYLPRGWEAEPAASPGVRRDVALDLVRGLAMVILVVNHLEVESPLEDVTSAVVSAAEVLVLVSGVVAGMVFGRRWRTAGPRVTTRMLLERARKLYVASVAVVVLVGLLVLVPGAATDALTHTRGIDTYAFSGPADAVWSVLTLAAGPWQFNILGFFITMLLATPVLLWALARGWWLVVAAASVGLYVAARRWDLEVLPSQSEQPFPLLIWQLLFVGGLLLGWHRERVERVLAGRGRGAGAVVVGVAVAGAAALLAGPGLESPWAANHFDKDSLDPLRLVAMAGFAGALYVVLRGAPAALGRLLGPLGRNSFYVFIVQVFVCLALASVPGLAGAGLAAAIAAQLGAVALLWAMVARRVWFRWIPR